MMMSCNIHFGTAELIKDKKNNTLVTSIEQVTQAYANGFRIKAILADGQLKHIQQLIEQKGITLTYAPPMNTYQKSKGTSEP